jgi:hypothetical protein
MDFRGGDRNRGKQRHVRHVNGVQCKALSRQISVNPPSSHINCGDRRDVQRCISSDTNIGRLAMQVRSTAMLEVGGSPTWTLTEDFALGMELKKFGWQCRYVQEYLAIGEAPDQIRNCYQQRSRWCKVSPSFARTSLRVVLEPHVLPHAERIAYIDICGTSHSFPLVG